MDSETSDRAHYFQDLYRLTSEDVAPSEKITGAIDIGRERLGVDYGVLSYTGEGAYEIVDTNISTGKFRRGSVSALEETWCRHVVQSRRSLAFADAADTAYRDDVAREATGLQCYVGSPILVDGETYGTLCFSDEEPRDEPITERERQFVALLADWIGYELERLKHHHQLRLQNERLDDFTGIVAHDLRNPLAGAVGALELAMDDAEGDVREFLEVVDDSLDRMDALIGECLMLAKEGTDVGQREEVDVASVARRAWQTLRTKGASLTIDIDRTVYADSPRLQRVFENLFRNAVEHCHPGVELTVEGRPDGFAISDDGGGLPDAVTEALTAADEENIKQLGLGLLIVVRVVAGHGWDLSVETSADGTTFEISGVNTAPPAHREIVGH